VNRNFRLTQSTDFKRVRRGGKSYAHPLFVLITMPAEGEGTRIGVTAGRALGGAIERNRAKRLIREAARPNLLKLKPGWKVIIIARPPLLKAEFSEIEASLHQLLMKADIVKRNHG
jgi:ribonuclease P protein component